MENISITSQDADLYRWNQPSRSEKRGAYNWLLSASRAGYNVLRPERWPDADLVIDYTSGSFPPKVMEAKGQRYVLVNFGGEPPTPGFLRAGSWENQPRMDYFFPSIFPDFIAPPLIPLTQKTDLFWAVRYYPTERLGGQEFGAYSRAVHDYVKSTNTTLHVVGDWDMFRDLPTANHLGDYISWYDMLETFNRSRVSFNPPASNFGCFHGASHEAVAMHTLPLMRKNNKSFPSPLSVTYNYDNVLATLEEMMRDDKAALGYEEFYQEHFKWHRYDYAIQYIPRILAGETPPYPF